MTNQTGCHTASKQRNITCGGTVFADLPPQAETQIIHKNDKDIPMIDFKKIKSTKLRVTFTTEDGLEHIKRGRVAQTICWLCERRERGFTSQEMSSWALRLAAYVHILRRKYNISIRTDEENHEGGSHGRYVLVSPVEIVKIEDLSQ